MATIAQQAAATRSPFWVRFGHLLLFGVYIALLAGRFSLDRLSDNLPGIDLRLVMIYVLGVAYMVWLAGAHQFLPPRVRARGALLLSLWLGWMALSAAWSPAGARVDDALLDLGLLAGFLLIAVGLVSRLPREVTSKVWRWVFWTGVIYFLGAMVEGPGVQGRYSAFGGGPNVFVRIMVLGAIAALYLSVVRGKARYLSAIPAFAVGAALSGSRGGLLSAAILLLLFLVPIIRMLGAKRTFAFTLIAAVGTSAMLAWRGSEITQFVADRFIRQTLVERYSSGRTDITQHALALWGEHGLVGTGLDGYYVLQPQQDRFEYPHNLLLASAAEGGSIGAALLILAILVFLLAVRRSRPVPAVAFVSLLAGVYLFVTSMFSGDYYDSRLMWFFFCLASVEAARPSPEVEVYPRETVRGVELSRVPGL